MINSLASPTSALGLEDVALEQFIDIFLHGVLNPDQNHPENQGNLPKINRIERL